MRVRVLCLAPYPSTGASNRLRFEQYIGPLRSHGVDLRMAPFLDVAGHRRLYENGATGQKIMGVARGVGRRVRDLVVSSRMDLVVVHRESAPIGPPVIERLLNYLNVPYVFDFDDAIFLGPIHAANRRWRWLRDPSRVSESARRAARVIVGNEYLASWARTHNPDVWIIPTAVDTDRHLPRPRSAVRDRIVIGWIGSSTTAPYLRLLEEPLNTLADEGVPIVLRLIDGDYVHPRVRTELRGYDRDSEPDDVADFDIGVLPEPDDPWTRGKGAFKALLYMAAGIPVVASNVGVNPAVIPDGKVGYCVDTPNEWAAALGVLARDPELRRRLGSAGRERVVANYSLHAQAPRLAEALLSVGRVRRTG